MNAKTLAELALKLWGVIQVISAVAGLPAAVWMLIPRIPDGDMQAAAAIRTAQSVSLVSLLAALIAGIVVVVWADNIVALFEDDTTPLQIGATEFQLRMLAFAIVGVMFLVPGIENAAVAGYTLLRKPSWDQTDAWAYLWARQSEAMVRAVVEIIAGATLVFGRTAIARGWSRMRGQEADAEPLAEPGDGDVEQAGLEEDERER